MTIIWNKSDPRIWFATVEDDAGKRRLHLIVERLPRSSDWDWAVWDRDAPRILWRGTAPSAAAAAAAAEAAARRWGQTRDSFPTE